ncbi:Hypothetical protein Cul210931_1742 [Corynebacterium ulcerans]|uniref:Transposase n=1 Tax=Corynebacterium ulcerans FRC58 TaxID=1408268 RepID=A0ABN4GW43_CORUL|nr:Hypothetical protein Cul210931_1742 [Corynebacterium ulcerans]AKN77735.1 Hypothetical protein CulFRC58_1881 [Corynebacterium ulcerans FRC58]
MIRNYLRIRGEKHVARHTAITMMGTTSAYAEKSEVVGNHIAIDGTTSAYAEKSNGTATGFRQKWNYLRIRGEKNH